MSMNREAIYSALFARLQSAFPWNTSSRVLLHWSEVPPVQQPAIFLAQVNETAQTITRQHTKWMLNVRVFIYANSQTPNGKAPATVMNAIIDAVVAAMAPPVPGLEVQNLGGLVDWARIEGTIETDEGLLGDQAVAIIPIAILTTA